MPKIFQNTKIDVKTHRIEALDKTNASDFLLTSGDAPATNTIEVINLRDRWSK